MKKHLKILGFVAMAAIGLIAFPADAATATGSVLCAIQNPCPEASKWTTGTTLDFTLKSGASALLVDTAGNTLDKCIGSTAKGKIEKSEAVTGSLESLTWTGCQFPTTTTKLGKLEVQNIAGTHNGTVVADDTTEVTINSVLLGPASTASQRGPISAN